MAVPLVRVVAVAGGVRAALWLAQRKRTKTVVLVGPPASGKTTLARFLTEGHERALPAGPTLVTKAYTGLIPGSKRIVQAFDMPGADGLATWKASIDKIDPDFVCLVLDFNRLVLDDDYLEGADRAARHVKAMVKRRRATALVLTHTDLQATTAAEPASALEDRRAHLVIDRLGAETRAAGSLADHPGAIDLRDSIWRWLG